MVEVPRVPLRDLASGKFKALTLTRVVAQKEKKKGPAKVSVAAFQSAV